jgi:XTP/dITP diphosphohydrolase
LTNFNIYLATGNPDKIHEIKAIISRSAPGANIELLSIQNMNIPEPDEPYNTFIENAMHKARYYAEQLQAPTLSEDAGLCIETLNNFPGVKTKDFLIECGSLEQAFAKLEQMLLKHLNYAAHFVCAAALYFPDQKKYLTFEGTDYGKISFPARGNKCFGFDPIFIPQGYNQTMSELGHEVKNLVGHRAIAIKGILDQLLKQGEYYEKSL